MSCRATSATSRPCCHCRCLALTWTPSTRSTSATTRVCWHFFFLSSLSVGVAHHRARAGYEHVAGTKLTAAELIKLIDTLDANGLLNYTHLLTGNEPCCGGGLTLTALLAPLGFVGSAEFLAAISEVQRRLRAVRCGGGGSSSVSPAYLTSAADGGGFSGTPGWCTCATRCWATAAACTCRATCRRCSGTAWWRTRRCSRRTSLSSSCSRARPSRRWPTSSTPWPRCTHAASRPSS